MSCSLNSLVISTQIKITHYNTRIISVKLKLFLVFTLLLLTHLGPLILEEVAAVQAKVDDDGNGSTQSQPSHDDIDQVYLASVRTGHLIFRV
jgi:hypothetical protein